MLKKIHFVPNRNIQYFDDLGNVDFKKEPVGVDDGKPVVRLHPALLRQRGMMPVPPGLDEFSGFILKQTAAKVLRDQIFQR